MNQSVFCIYLFFLLVIFKLSKKSLVFSSQLEGEAKVIRTLFANRSAWRIIRCKITCIKAVQWCIAFVYLCNVLVLFLFMLLLVGLWITKTFPLVGLNWISIIYEWKMQVPQGSTVFSVFAFSIFHFSDPPYRSECVDIYIYIS